MNQADRPLVSVVLPMRNAEPHLETAYSLLRSLTTERCDLEFVIVDDGSTDSTAGVVAAWRDRLPGRMVLLAGEGRGVAAARNLAISLCVGDYVWMADVDDSWEPNIVDRLVEAVNGTNSQIAICAAERTAADGRVTGRIDQLDASAVHTGSEAFVLLLEGRISGHLWNKLFARNLLGVDPFPIQRAHSDLGGILRIMQRSEKVSISNAVLYRYRQNPNSILTSSTYKAEDLDKCLLVAEQVVSVRGNGVEDEMPLTRFKYSTILVPQLNESLRPHGNTSDRMRVKELRRRLHWLEMKDLLRGSKGFILPVVIKSLCFKISPSLYLLAKRLGAGLGR